MLVKCVYYYTYLILFSFTAFRMRLSVASLTASDSSRLDLSSLEALISVSSVNYHQPAIREAMSKQKHNYGDDIITVLLFAISCAFLCVHLYFSVDFKHATSQSQLLHNGNNVFCIVNATVMTPSCFQS